MKHNSNKSELWNRIRRENTKVKEVDEKFSVFLKIDHQSFCVANERDEKVAQFYQDQIATALERFLQKYV
jgi:predicted nucleic-acid-binding Zn-ribbon protein